MADDHNLPVNPFSPPRSQATSQATSSGPADVLEPAPLRARLALPATVDNGSTPTSQVMAPAALHLRSRLDLGDAGDDDDLDMQMPLVPAAAAAAAMPPAAMLVTVAVSPAVAAQPPALPAMPALTQQALAQLQAQEQLVVQAAAQQRQRLLR